MLIKLKTSNVPKHDTEDLLVKVKVKRENPHVILPSYYSDGAAGMDIHANENCVLRPGETKLVGTGLFLEIPVGYEVQIRSRSGLALKGIVVSNAPGTIDSDYRGEVKVILHNQNHSRNASPFSIVRGDRIAQIVLKKVHTIQWQEESELSITNRNDQGFGSSGIN